MNAVDQQSMSNLTFLIFNENLSMVVDGLQKIPFDITYN